MKSSKWKGGRRNLLIVKAIGEIVKIKGNVRNLQNVKAIGEIFKMERR
jgi:hypothetical protein